MDSPRPLVREGNETTVPIRIIEGFPTIAVNVNGHGPFLFAIDTGQPFAISVSPDAMESMRLVKTGEVAIGDPSGDSHHSIASFTIDQVNLGGVTFKQVDGSAAAMRHAPGSQIVGTIGMGMFDGLMPTIDYGRLKFTLRSGSLPAVDGKDIIAVSVDEMGLICLPVTIGERVWVVHLDTGNARAALFMPAATVSSLPIKGAPRAIGVAHTVSRQVQLNAIDLAAPVRIGSTQLSVTSVSYPSVADIGNLGSPGLVGTSVTIDLSNHRVRIQASP